MASKLKTFAWAALLLLSGVIAYSFGIKAYREANPAQAFASLVGIQPPPGTHVSAYASALTDNFFHHSHFWLVEGDARALRTLAAGAGFGRSDEDARSRLPEAAALFGMQLGPQEMAEGYESDHSRNRWLLILKDGRHAIYIL